MAASGPAPPRPEARFRALAGRHVLITGGSEGIGLEVARVCTVNGAKISLLARSAEKLERVTNELRALAAPDAAAPAVGFQPADVGDAQQVQQALRTAAAARGPVDVCICCAGAALPKYFEDLEHADFERMMRVNYYGIVNVAKELLPLMAARDKERRRGEAAFSFCAVASMVAAVPFVGYAAYAPAKAATRSLMDVLRNEYADTGVRLHVAFPPDTDTPGFVQENSTKPYETSHIWPECFNEVFPARQVAERLLQDMLKGKYFVTSPDVFGNVLVSRAWGHYPRGCLRSFVELFLAPVFVLLHSLMVWMADRAVRLRRHHHQDERQGGET